MVKQLINKRFITGLIVCAVLFCSTFYIHAFHPYPGEGEWPKTLLVNNGDTLAVIAKKARENRIIRSKTFFKLFSIVLGKGNSYKRGEYQFDRKLSAYQLTKILEEGKTKLLSITLPEGLRMKEIFPLLRNGDYENEGLYEHYATNGDFITSLKVPVKLKTLEGFLFPETYKFAKDSSERMILRTMVNTFLKKVPEDYSDLAKQVGLSYYEAVILASIIEKETSVADERSLIASVFHNRLEKSMRLQTDPTVIYGIKNFNGNLTRKQLRTKTPYNTYLIKGLPPTPIANPGIASLMAAVNPAKTQYLYFVAKGDGTHEFSTNYTQHSHAVTKYQRRRKKNYRSY